jgi:hypothetical protein
MSDINLDFTVSNNSINFTVEPNDITITPTDIQLTINPSISPGAGGNIGELQYNDGSLLAGIPTATYTSGNLALGNVANLKITGGTNGYVLQTDGTGNLDWAAMAGGGGNGSPGGSNTQIQYNDNGTFGGNAGFTFNEVSGNVAIPGSLSVTGNITGNVQNAYLANFATVANSVAGANVSGVVANANYSTYSGIAGTANSVAGANVSGEVAFAAVANSVAGANVSGQVANALIASTVYTNAQPNITSTGVLSNLSVSGNVTANYFIGDGGNISNITSANFANFAGNVTVSAQPNITSLGTLTGLTLGYSSIALGNGAVAGNNSVSIGGFAGATIGNGGPYANSTVTIGQGAGGGNYRGNFSVAIGFAAGGNLGLNSIAIGNCAAVNGNGLNYGNYTVINATGANLDPTISNSFYVKPIRNATSANILYYDNSTGEITYQTGSGITPPAGSNTQIQFNNSNSFGSSANFTFNRATNLLNVTGTVSATGTITGGNVSTGGVVTASGNVTGGNIRTVNGYVESQNGNIYANNGYMVGGEGVFTNLRFVSNISSNASPSAVGASVASHKFPIVLNGTTYYILLTT